MTESGKRQLSGEFAEDVCRFTLLAILVFFTFGLLQVDCSRKSDSVENFTSFVAGGEVVHSVEGAAASDELHHGKKSGGDGNVDNVDSIERVIKIAFSGDIILHGRVKETASNQARSPSEKGDDKFEGWWHVFKRLKTVIEGCQIAMANLETPIAKERRKPRGRPPVLNGPPQCLYALKEVGFTVMNFANNHSYDQMREGVAETIQSLERAGLKWVGAGRTRKEAVSPLVEEVDGLKVAMLGWSLVLNSNFNDPRTPGRPWVNVYSGKEAVSKIREIRDSVDLVVVNIHWGGEFEMRPGARQTAIARQLCEAGADVIIGHGPHILQRVKFIETSARARRCLVAFSLGNLVSNQGLKYRYGWRPPNLVEAKNIPYTRDSVVLRIFTSVKEGVAEIASVEAVPLWTENNYLMKYVYNKPPPADIFVTPIIPYLDFFPGKSRKRLLLEERLEFIKKMIGNEVVFKPY